MGVIARSHSRGPMANPSRSITTGCPSLSRRTLPMLASPWMTPGGIVNSSPAYRARIWVTMAVRKARSCGFSQVLVIGDGELVQLDHDLGDFGDTGVLVAVVGGGVPEGDHVLAEDDRLID